MRNPLVSPLWHVVVVLSVGTLPWSATAVAFAQEKGDTSGASAKERARLQGTWLWVSAKVNGEEMDDPAIKAGEVATVIKGDEMKVTAKGQQSQESTFRLDPDKEPREIDITFKRGEMEFTLKGIYSLDGDTLKLCYGDPSVERPTKFASEPGSKIGLLELRRQKP